MYDGNQQMEQGPPERTTRTRGLNLYWILATMSLALLLRLYAFVGWGLGDDAYYGWLAHYLSTGHFPGLSFGSNYRLGLHLPNAASFWLFGVNDLSFVLFPFVCSLATIPVTYLLGNEIAEGKVGLLAATLLAFSPFDVVFSTTMTIDIITSFLSALAFLLFLKADRANGLRSHGLFILGAVLVFYCYLVKIPAIAIVGIFAVLSALHLRAWKRHAVFYAALAALLGTFCLIDFFSTGGFFNYLHREGHFAPKYVQGHLSDYLKFYPSWMFRLTFDQTLLFGYTFYAVLPALAYALYRRLHDCLPLTVWLVGLFLVLEFLPSKASLPYEPIPRFFRYLDALVVPSLLLVAVLIASIAHRSRWLGGAILAFLLVGSLFWIQRTASLYQDSLRDMKIASAFLVTRPEGDLYSDNRFLDRFRFDRGYQNAPRIKYMQEAIEKHRASDLLASFRPGYAVTGGARGPDMWMGAIFNLGSLTPPPTWRLLRTVEGEIRPWRQEALRIYRIEGLPGAEGNSQLK